MTLPSYKGINRHQVNSGRRKFHAAAFQLSNWGRELYQIYRITAEIREKASSASTFDKDYLQQINGHSDAFGTT